MGEQKSESLISDQVTESVGPIIRVLKRHGLYVFNFPYQHVIASISNGSRMNRKLKSLASIGWQLYRRSVHYPQKPLCHIDGQTCIVRCFDGSRRRVRRKLSDTAQAHT